MEKTGSTTPPPRRLLLVDDEPTILELLQEVLEEAGFQVSTALSGEEALRQVSNDATPDIVLMDVVMSGISGAEAMEAIHRIRPDLPVALMSGVAPTVRPWPPAGAAGFFPKPMDVGSLASRLRELL